MRSGGRNAIRSFEVGINFGEDFSKWAGTRKGNGFVDFVDRSIG